MENQKFKLLLLKVRQILKLLLLSLSYAVTVPNFFVLVLISTRTKYPRHLFSHSHLEPGLSVESQFEPVLSFRTTTNGVHQVTVIADHFTLQIQENSKRKFKLLLLRVHQMLKLLLLRLSYSATVPNVILVMISHQLGQNTPVTSGSVSSSSSM